MKVTVVELGYKPTLLSDINPYGWLDADQTCFIDVIFLYKCQSQESIRRHHPNRRRYLLKDKLGRGWVRDVCG
jgi:hypothetical protein